MKLTASEARSRLTAHDHGVLCTVHADRGVDAVPVVYAVVDDFLGVPIDRVKPKSSLRLQRQTNLEADPRATLLVEQWDRQDWSKLWWVRAELRFAPDEADQREADQRSAALAAQLTEAFPQYQDQPFAGFLLLRIVSMTGWSATG